MAPGLMRFAVLSTSYVLAMGLSAFLGYRYADAQGAKSLAECVQGRAEQQSRALTLAEARVSAARSAGDAAVRKEAARRLLAEQQTREVKHEIQRVAVGRPCLSGELVGVLNRAPGIAPGGAELPADPGRAVDAAAAVAAADGARGAPYVDDADVAGWIADAAGLYDACRGRIDALRTWSEALP